MCHVQAWPVWKQSQNGSRKAGELDKPICYQWWSFSSMRNEKASKWILSQFAMGFLLLEDLAGTQQFNGGRRALEHPEPWSLGPVEASATMAADGAG